MTRNTKTITISVSILQNKLLIKAKQCGYFPSKSEAVRFCLNNSLQTLMNEMDLLNDYIKEKDLSNVLKLLKKHGYIIHPNKQHSRKIPLGNIFHNSNNEVKQ